MFGTITKSLKGSLDNYLLETTLKTRPNSIPRILAKFIYDGMDTSIVSVINMVYNRIVDGDIFLIEITNNSITIFDKIANLTTKIIMKPTLSIIYKGVNIPQHYDVAILSAVQRLQLGRVFKVLFIPFHTYGQLGFKLTKILTNITKNTKFLDNFIQNSKDTELLSILLMELTPCITSIFKENIDQGNTYKILCSNNTSINLIISNTDNPLSNIKTIVIEFGNKSIYIKHRPSLSIEYNIYKMVNRNTVYNVNRK